MPICDPCADAADADATRDTPKGHDPAICRDHAIQPHGCACAHGPAGTAIDREGQAHA